MLGALIILLAGSTLYLLIKPPSAPDYVEHTSMKRSADHQKLLMGNPSFLFFLKVIWLSLRSAASS
jgi:hypothetical protein